MPRSSAATAESWTTAIRAAATHNRPHRALVLYALLHRSALPASPHAISAALKSCSRLPSITPSSSLHAHALKLGHLPDPFVHSALLAAYSKLTTTHLAQKLFDGITHKSAVSYNTLLSAYIKSGNLVIARNLFDEMPVRDTVSYNTMLSGYAKSGDMDRAMHIFRSMPETDAASWNGMVSGYVYKGEMWYAREVFEEMPERSNVSWVTMISGYAKCGEVDSAWGLFVRVGERDVFCWNAVIACFTQNGRCREGLRLFTMMQVVDGVYPDEMTFSSVLSACSQLRDLRYGLWVEKYMVSLGIELDDHLATTLVDLYSKCGNMDRAFELFGGLRKREVVSVSAMIFGCGTNGKLDEAIGLFNEMLDAGISPNVITFVGLLTAYRHAGMVEEGWRCFNSMWSKHQVAPSVDHYAIMVDLLGRCGRLEEARGLVEKMPMKPHVGVWGALLLACRLHGNVELGELAAERCFELEPLSSGYYVLLASIYAEAGKWEKARRLRKLMAEKGLAKLPGCSWVQST